MSRAFRRACAPVVALLVLCGCDHSVVTEARGRRIPSSQLSALNIGSTTVADIESQFGDPDERASDGALTYRYTTVRQVRRQFAGWTVSLLPADERVTVHAVTFRFTGGKLSRICRTRS